MKIREIIDTHESCESMMESLEIGISVTAESGKKILVSWSQAEEILSLLGSLKFVLDRILDRAEVFL